MKRVFFMGMLAMLSIASFAQTDKSGERKTQFNLSKDVAIKGYDPTSYFIGKPKEGKPSFTATYMGVTYYFASAENRDLFKKNPAQYEPQYGGWCAFAMGNDGSKVEVDPETYKIANGKLYLFYNKFFTNTLKSWNKDEAHLMKSADANWMKIYK
ncbi:YHS domain-containing (seleno)protein [Parasediminibacterium sp. JCM 36343]|uniref:YHS domain-containing (seleno)protein n=1 Tax=Parasediminibacterium sp. JCM 36343 TaxID=3374279 RepID=UPI003979A694